MSDLTPYRRYEPGRAAPSGTQPTSLADILDRVLDKGLVIAGDISISLAQVELITIKIRLLLASADKAKEMGIDWWTRDASLSGGAGGGGEDAEDMDKDELVEQNRVLQERLATMEERLHGLLHQPESTAAAPAPISAADLVGEQAGRRARGAAVDVDSGVDTGEGGDREGEEPEEAREDERPSGERDDDDTRSEQNED